MQKDSIIYLVDQSKWSIPMVAQPKKNDPKKLRVCVDFWCLNRVSLINPFPTPFTDKIINEVARHECYSFTVVLLVYNQAPIHKKKST